MSRKNVLMPASSFYLRKSGSQVQIDEKSQNGAAKRYLITKADDTNLTVRK